MKHSRIEWTDNTFNPWIGCTKVGPECDHCYAESMSSRRKWAVWGPGKPRHRTGDANWSNPRRWNREAERRGTRPRVFCASLADWADQEVPGEWRRDLMRLIAECPNLDWLLLTKRAGAARAYLNDLWRSRPWPHVWIGVTAGTQATWDTNVGHLMETNAAVRWVSMEPLLEAVAVDQTGRMMPDWLVLGDESGPKARPGDPEWHRQVISAARGTGTRVFVKQLCTRGRKIAYEEWPADLRMREYPRAAPPIRSDMVSPFTPAIQTRGIGTLNSDMACS